ncbi:endoglucanase-like [Neltuma alba]|uniref:endoglucanase-like n=1 Tax=Neltuma alba TaxID=207710 RepID=UPI0010A365BC|nr:endoglucanase-like [Prosopis alba]
MEYYRLVWCLVLCALFVHINGAAMLDERNRNSSDTYDYGDAIGKAILFFEGQRSGKLPSSQRMKWRGDSALSDGKLENVNLVGGYYDAGDNVKFVWPMSFSVSLLSWAAIEYQSGIASVNQTHYLQSAIRWGSDFILLAHSSPTTLFTQVGDGNADHQCWERPEDMDTPRTLYKIDANSPGSEVAAESAAALSAASIVFQKVDSNYSSRLLNQSKSLFDFADKYRGSYSQSCPFYCSYSGYQDELLWAASWLYKASGESKYMDYILSNQGSSQVASEFSWDNKFVGAQTLLAHEFYGEKKDQLAQFRSNLESFICSVMPGSNSQQIKTTPGGLLYVRDSSNLQYVTSLTTVLFTFSNILKSNHIDGIQCGSTHFTASQITAFAKTQVDYILGNNPMKMSYMVGFGSKYPRHIHHRGSSIPSIKDHPAKVGCNDGQSDYYSSTNPNPNILVGAIVGGPDSNDQFNDVRSDYSHSEPTTYMNAAFVSSLAALLPAQNSNSAHY